jgi:hypothetical protein
MIGKIAMKMKLFSGSTLVVTLAVLVLGSTVSGQDSSKTKGSTKAILNIPSAPEVAIPQSIFTIPSQPSEGRNPFFPQSIQQPVLPKITKETPVDPTLFFVLNGITSPPKRTAMINGRTFEPGEEGEVRISSGGKVMLKCLEIKSDSAIIEVEGQRHTLRLRSGL